MHAYDDGHPNRAADGEDSQSVEHPSQRRMHTPGDLAS